MKISDVCKAILSLINEGILYDKNDPKKSKSKKIKMNQENQSEKAKNKINLNSKPWRDRFLETVVAEQFDSIIKIRKYRDLFMKEINKRENNMK